VVRKVAAGAAETVPLVAVVNLARTLRALKGARRPGSSHRRLREKTLYEADLKGFRCAGHGLRRRGHASTDRECCDSWFSIPMAGAVESLNVSVAAGVALFEAVRQRSGGVRRSGSTPGLGWGRAFRARPCLAKKTCSPGRARKPARHEAPGRVLRRAEEHSARRKPAPTGPWPTT